MQEHYLADLLDKVRQQTMPVEEAIEALRDLPMELLAFARLDHHRALRTGLPEAVFAERKSVDQLIGILAAMINKPEVVLATRVSPRKAEILTQRLTGLHYHPQARMLTANAQYIPPDAGRGKVIIVTAGTADLPVAEEARITLQYLGHETRTIYDAGVAGIHRILAHAPALRKAGAIITLAGMDGALPSVVAGLSPAPVIGVPCSTGYGAGAGGFAALLAMLNACAPGLAVVNIDNGFGAACMAAAINRR